MDSAVGLLLEGLAALVCCCTANLQFGRSKEKNSKPGIPLDGVDQADAAGNPNAPYTVSVPSSFSRAARCDESIS